MVSGPLKSTDIFKLCTFVVLLPNYFQKKGQNYCNSCFFRWWKFLKINTCKYQNRQIRCRSLNRRDWIGKNAECCRYPDMREENGNARMQISAKIGLKSQLQQFWVNWLQWRVVLSCCREVKWQPSPAPIKYTNIQISKYTNIKKFSRSKSKNPNILLSKNLDI